MERIFPGFYAGRVGAALLALRLIAGLAFIFHGWPKIMDPAGFAERLKVPWILGAAAAWTEVLGGAALILGLLTPLAALLIGIEMIVAYAMVHGPAGHPFVNPGGASFELAALYFVMMAAFLLAGPGAYSVDARLFGFRPAGETPMQEVPRRRVPG